MLNWEIDPEVVAPYVPFGTEIDFHEDKTYVSMVGFMFLKTRVLGIPVPFHRNFEELNLRYYIKRQESDSIAGQPTIKRGVGFVSELVPRWAIATTARLGYNEKYSAVPMGHTIHGGSPTESIGVEYRWKSGDRWNRISAQGDGQAKPTADQSQEQFIAEHYWGYSAQRDGTTLEYQVKHPPWSVWSATDVELEFDVTQQYGPQLADTLSRVPDSAFIADGSAVTVSRPRRIS